MGSGLCLTFLPYPLTKYTVRHYCEMHALYIGIVLYVFLCIFMYYLGMTYTLSAQSNLLVTREHSSPRFGAQIHDGWIISRQLISPNYCVKSPNFKLQGPSDAVVVVLLLCLLEFGIGVSFSLRIQPS